MQLEEQRSMISTARWRCRTKLVALWHWASNLQNGKTGESQNSNNKKSLFFPDTSACSWVYIVNICVVIWWKSGVHFWKPGSWRLMSLGERIERLRANNNRCLRFSLEAHKIREHPLLGPCIQALIHPHVSPFQRRHLSESWQQIRPHPLVSYRARLLLITFLIFCFFFQVPLLTFRTQMAPFENRCRIAGV